MKKYGKSILCLLLVLALCLSLAACGKKEEQNKTDEEIPEYVYSAEFQPLNVEEDSYVNARVFTDDGFYATGWVKIGERELNEGETLDYEGQLDIYGPKLYFISLDGAMKELTAYEPMPTPVDTEGRANYSANVDLTGLGLRDDGKLLVVESVGESWYDGDPKEINTEDDWVNWRYESSFYIRVLNPDGSEVSTAPVEIDYDPQQSYISFYNMLVDDQGNAIGTGDNGVIAVAADGSVAYTIESEDYVNNMLPLRDGSIGVTRWGDTGMELVRLDTAAGRFGEVIPLPANAYDVIPGGGDYDLYYRNGTNLYGYNFETQANDKILNWLSCDINGDYMNGIRVAEDGTITGIMTSWRSEDRDVEFVTISKVPYDSVPHKESITLAVLWTDYELSDRVIEFNRKSDDVRIDVVDYSEYNTEDDYSAGQTKLLTEIMAGNMPDLFVLDQMPYRQLAAKGLLEDLYPYLDADAELKREDFFPSVLHAMESDGKLCRVAPGFGISTLAGASSVVGDEPGWNYDQFREALASMPEGCDALDQYTTRGDVLQQLVYLDMEDFVDWNTGKCSFDSQEFIDVLEFANTFQVDFDWENYEWTEEESTMNRLAAGRQMLMNTSIYSMDDMLYNDVYFGGSCTYIGWPTNNGVGNMINLLNGSYGMSVNCKNKEAAWQFLRTFLTADFQKDLYGLPSNTHAFDTMLKAIMKPEYLTDAEGNAVLDDNGEKIQVSRGNIGMSDGSTFRIYAMTQEQADKLVQLINSADRTADYDTGIFDIVNEQAQAYFAGQKSAAEVAKLIQSRANLFVNEQR